MRLYLIRHPQPLIAKAICYGRTDVAVAPREQARVLSTMLATLPGNTRIFSSPLQRCAELAVRAAEALGHGSVSFDARLVEMYFGNWELRTWNDIPRAEIDAWADNPVNYAPGGGETVLQMAQRVRAFYRDALLLQQDCAVICHAGTIRLLLACRHDFSLSEIAFFAARTRHKVAYGEVLILDC